MVDSSIEFSCSPVISFKKYLLIVVFSFLLQNCEHRLGEVNTSCLLAGKNLGGESTMELGSMRPKGWELGAQMGRDSKAALALGSTAKGSGLPQCLYHPSLNCSAFTSHINNRWGGFAYSKDLANLQCFFPSIILKTLLKALKYIARTRNWFKVTVCVYVLVYLSVLLVDGEIY